MQMDDMVIISVDDHAIEPPEAFIRHYPEGKKDRAPRIVNDGGKDVWQWNGQRFPTIGLNAVVGRPRSEYGMEPTAFDQLRPGTYDPKLRVDDMNANGVLVDYDCAKTTAWVNRAVWTKYTVEQRRNMVMSLATVCSTLQGTYRISVLDYDSKREIGAFDGKNLTVDSR